MKPLEGLRILAVTQYGSGPYSMMHLADMGAEIIKIENPKTEGDVSRYVIPYSKNNDSLYFQALNRNNKGITLDLNSKEGKKIFHQLVEKSDAVFNNLRGDVPDKLGIKYEYLKEINPTIVTCSLSGFGTQNSKRSLPAYDYLMQAMNGHMALTGEPDGIPSKYGLSIIDWSTGVMAALGLMIGIFQAKIHHKGSDVDVSLFDTSISVLNYIATWHLNEGYKPQRSKDSAHPSLVPSQLFSTSDGYVLIMCNKEKFFDILCEEMGIAKLAQNKKYDTFQARLENKEELITYLQSLLIEHTTEYWMEKLNKKVPVAPVNTIEDALKQPLIKENDMIVDIHSENFGDMKGIGTPIKVSNYKPSYSSAPTLGMHNYEVYHDLLNINDEYIEELKSKGII